MARKPKDEAEKPTGETARKKKLLERLREDYKLATEADEDNRRQAMADLKFMNEPGAQWDENQKKRRGKRPCYEFNLTNTRAKRVINDMRANRAQGKVRATEDGDKDTADVYEGLIRNIANVSDFDSVTDYAAEYQVGGGMGAWRVATEYASDDAFDQEIRIEAIRNPFCLYGDPAATDMMKRDGRFWILTDRIAKSSYESRWPHAKLSDFEESEFDDNEDWLDENTVRICEYWYKVPVQKEIVLLADGRTIDAEELKKIPAAEVVRRRTVNSYKIRMCIASGAAILEERDWPGCKFPFVQVFGCWLVIDGKVVWYGLIRNGKDAQRAVNVMQTAAAEAVMSAPLAKFWATTKQAEGMVPQWSAAHDENIPAMLYNADPQAPGTPQRMGGADVPAALLQLAATSEQLLNGVMGIHEASLGERGDEKSGRAIAARQRQGEIATFNFADNMAKGIRHTWEIIVDLIPRVITNERAMRILGADGAEKYVKVNSVEVDPKTLEGKPVNDLKRGKYDVTITVGPSFSTQRQEATELYTALAQSNPAIWGVAGDLIMRGMDLPYSEQIAERLKTLLPPQIQQQLVDGKPLPPEVQAAMAQVDQLMQQVQMMGQAAQEQAAEAQKLQSQADKAKSDAQIAQANIKVAEANLDKQVAEFKQLVAETQAQAAQEAAQQAGEQAKVEGEQKAQELSQQLAEAVAGIQQQVQQLMQAYAQQIAGMIPPPAPPKPKRTGRSVAMKRGKDGQQTGQVTDTFEDGSTVVRDVILGRVNGQLMGQINEPQGTLQ